MIKNALQYRVTKAQIERFEESLRELEARPDRDELSRLNIEAMRSQLDDLRAQIAEYQSLESGRPRELRFTSLDDIANLLIKARIASGLSHKQLAETLGMKEQQIQRYEATDFESASLARILEIADALGLSASGLGVLSDPTPSSPSQFLANLQMAGIDRWLVLDRLLPEYLSARFANGIPPDQTELKTAASSVARVFGWQLDLILRGPLDVDPARAGIPRFKVRKGTDVGRATAYTIYAHYLALVVLECVRDIAMQEVPTDPKVVREAIITKSQKMTFETVLEYVWSLGIPVLPLNDPGAFQAACWRANHRNVIVLKQQSQSLSRWAFDVLHEIWHLGQEPDAPQLSVIELGDTTGEEWAANEFAGNVLLDGRAEELAEKCVVEARNSVERLKSVVPTVASREGVESDALANYMAYRLSFQDVDWWGAAANLQTGKPGEPWRIARDFLLKQMILERLDPLDRNLLRRALQG